MNGSSHLPSIDSLKSQAKRLRAELTATGTEIGHGRSLELLAHQHGYKDWNTLHAAVGNRPPTCPVELGQTVSGQYLGQAFTGEVIAVQTLSAPGLFRVTFDFDEPVDVVTFDSFSAFRKRVSCFIDSDGVTKEKTSDGRPQLKLDRNSR
ncbi:MAG: glyoxalase superfamily protein [Stappiaceae bacterium]